MSHCHECLHGIPIYPTGSYICPSTADLIHPVVPFGPTNSPASWGINLATSNLNAPRIFVDYIIQVYNPYTPFNSKTFVSPNSGNFSCPNTNPTIYNGTGNVERALLFIADTNLVYTVANGIFDASTAYNNSLPSIGTYCWADVIDGLNAVNALLSLPTDFIYGMTLVDMLTKMNDYAPGDRYRVNHLICGCSDGPCYCSPCWHNNSLTNCREFGVTGNSGLGLTPGSVQHSDWAPFEGTTSTAPTFIPSTMSFIDVSVTDMGGTNVTSWLQDLFLAVNAGTAYTASITTLYNQTVSEVIFTVNSVSAIATSSSGGDYYRVYLSWDSSSANANLHAHGVRICFYVSGTSPYGSVNHSSPNCIYSTIDLQLCIDSAAATPCCIPPPGFPIPIASQFNQCSEVLARHLLGDGGTPIKISDVRYEPSLGNYSFGNCVYDPEDKKYKCCTFDENSDLANEKTIACRIINGKFINDYGIWRSCERSPMLWDCVSSVNSCDNFKNTSSGYTGSFRSMSQVDSYYENIDATENITNTHFNMLLSPKEMSLSESAQGWCTSSTNKYTYTPKYRITVTTPGSTGQVVGGPDTGLGCCIALNCPAKGKGCKCMRTTVMGSGIIECHCEGSCGDDNKHHVSIEAESFDGLISGNNSKLYRYNCK